MIDPASRRELALAKRLPDMLTEAGAVVPAALTEALAFAALVPSPPSRSKDAWAKVDKATTVAQLDKALADFEQAAAVESQRPASRSLLEELAFTKVVDALSASQGHLYESLTTAANKHAAVFNTQVAEQLPSLLGRAADELTEAQFSVITTAKTVAGQLDTHVRVIDGISRALGSGTVRADSAHGLYTRVCQLGDPANLVNLDSAAVLLFRVQEGVDGTAHLAALAPWTCLASAGVPVNVKNPEQAMACREQVQHGVFA